MMGTRQTATDRSGAVRKSRTVPRIEAIGVVVSLVVIAALAAADIVRDAPADAPVVQASFDVAPAAEWSPRQPQPDGRHDRWAADESARGTSPNATH